MSTPAFAVTSPLTMRLLRRILLLCAALILVFAGVRAWWKYNAELESSERFMAHIEETLAKPLANSLWDLDTEQVGLLLEGIGNSPVISYAAVLEHGRPLAVHGEPKADDVLVREITLLRWHEGRAMALGTLVLQVDRAQARALAFNSALASLAFSSCLVLFVALAIFLLTRSMISRHLATAAQHFQSLHISSPADGFKELRLDKKWAGDELDILSMAVNSMQENLARTYAQAWLAEQEARSQARFPEENPNPVLRISANGELISANQASKEFLAHLDRTLGQSLPEEYAAIVRAAQLSWEMQQFEAGFCGRTYAFVARPIRPDGYVNIYGMDITERKQAADAISRSLAEKEILLKEIHHRVKNNLQIISSLLFLQMEYVSDPRDRELFTESQKRIQAMALVHEELYGAADLSSVDMREYVPRLVERVLASAVIPVLLHCKVDEVRLPVTRSIPCGLVLNELVMNAVKHAFRPGQAQGVVEGMLRVVLLRQDGQLVLEVEDNGPGLPADFSIESTPTLGMTLVSSLTQQLGGSVTAHNGPSGACFQLRLPLEEQA